MSLSLNAVIGIYSNNGIWDDKTKAVFYSESKNETEKLAHEYAKKLVKSGMSAEESLLNARSIFGASLSTRYDIEMMNDLEADNKEFERKLRKNPSLGAVERKLFLCQIVEEAGLCEQAGLPLLFFCPASKLVDAESLASKSHLKLEASERKNFYAFV